MSTEPHSELPPDASDALAQPEPGRIDKLIINSPYTEPDRHWQNRGDASGFVLAEGRRPPGYVISGSGPEGGAGPVSFEPLALANRLRDRVKQWRQAGYPGITGVTQRLLQHWNERTGFEQHQFFFCQMEAIETLIWLTEAPEAARVGVEIPSDGSDFTRICSKMATGAGKTVVMAMLVAWHVCNKVTYPNDKRYSRNVLVVAPGLTVRSRLDVLNSHSSENYYDEFDIVPVVYRDKLRQGRVEIRNWHALQSETAAQTARRKGVDKRGPRSDAAYARDVLGDMASARNVLVINDEAHHAWRVPPDATAVRFERAELEEATRWVEGLDRIHRVRGILRCHDFTATPFVPSGRGKNQQGSERPFGWVVSDFGLNDAIESGLVKTPRVVIRDDAMPDANTYKSRMYHIYDDNSVKGDLNRKAAEAEPLPDLVRAAYRLLGHDWQITADAWGKAGHPVGPVMISVTNRTETAARVKHAFDNAKIRVEGLCEPELTLHIDSKVLAKAEQSETPIAALADGIDEAGSGSRRTKGPTKNEKAELLRRQVDTVGKPGEPGQDIRHVISVAMLSEGWDAKTVTHIMGLRAFTSQLLCEQVIGRGLRRTSYEIDGETGMFGPEFVNIFGVPFAFLPQQDPDDEGPLPPQPKTEIRPDPAKAHLEISFPNVVRIERTLAPRLSLDLARIEPLVLDSSGLPTRATLAESIQGQHDETRTHTIEPGPRRLQTLLFEMAGGLYHRLATHDDLGRRVTGNRAVICVQLMRLLETFVTSGKLELQGVGNTPAQVLIEQHSERIASHVLDAIRSANVESIEPVFDTERPILSTADMGRWWTGKPNGPAQKSHINRCVYDSGLEKYVAGQLDDSDLVQAWAKNDHLGFEVAYVHGGVPRRYIPDFLVRLTGDHTLVLEVKGDPLDLDRSKEKYLEQWVEAVNSYGEFGTWSCAMYTPADDLGWILADNTGR